MPRRYGRYRGDLFARPRRNVGDSFSEIVGGMGDGLGFLLMPEAYVEDTSSCKPWGLLGETGSV